jgi:PleD family two-component response regulator
MDLSCQSMAALMLTDCNRYQRFGSPEGARRHETPAGDECSVPQKNGHIIVVDDDESIRRLVTDYFEEQNIPVSAASNRSDLNRHFARAYPSLIILDLRLGDDNGLDES